MYACGRREAELAALRDEVTRAGGRLEPVVMDVTRGQETIGRIREIDQGCGGLDLVVANAGIGLATSARKMKWENVEKMIQVNVVGSTATLAAVLPAMVERNRGHLVGISSIAAYRGLPRMAGYCASKAYLATFLESLRVDLVHTKVRVSSIHPGYVKSEMTAGNKYPMPFLMETDAAVEEIGRAIVRQVREYVIPWQWRSAMRAVRLMPNAAWDVAAQKLR